MTKKLDITVKFDMTLLDPDFIHFLPNHIARALESAGIIISASEVQIYSNNIKEAN